MPPVFIKTALNKLMIQGRMYFFFFKIISLKTLNTGGGGPQIDFDVIGVQAPKIHSKIIYYILTLRRISKML